MSYKENVSKIIEKLGGPKNIRGVTHCYTRLRFNLVDEAVVKDEEVEKLPGVMGVTRKAGVYQVIIGNEVSKYYKEIMAMPAFKNLDDSNSNDNQKPQGNLIERFFNMISNCMSPLIPAMIAGGMVKVLLLLLTMTISLETSSQTYQLLNTIGDGTFFFLPMLLAYSSARYFKVTPVLAMVVVAVLVHPGFSGLFSAGEPVSFFGIPVTNVGYSYSVIPVIMIVAATRYIEKFAELVTPSIAQNFLKPLLVLLISAPVAFQVLGPIGVFASQYFTAGLMFIYKKVGVVAFMILAAFMPLIVMTGMHQAFAPIMLTSIATLGYDPLIIVAMLGSNLAQGGASLAVAVKAKNQQQKEVAFSAAFTALLSGISEPAMYGVTIKLKKPMIACIISGAITGLFMGIVALKAYVMATPGLISLALFIAPDGSSSLLFVLMAAAIAIVTSFVLTWIIGFDDPEETAENESKSMPVSREKIIINSPIAGDIKALSEIDDATFAKKMLGEGVAIVPKEGKVFAPFDGTIEVLLPSTHAIGLKNDDGVELLIHVGIDTVNLNGEHFQAHVKQGQRVKKGDLLLEFDIAKIKAKGYELVTPIIVTNSNTYLEVFSSQASNAKIGDELVWV